MGQNEIKDKYKTKALERQSGNAIIAGDCRGAKDPRGSISERLLEEDAYLIAPDPKWLEGSPSLSQKLNID